MNGKKFSVIVLYTLNTLFKNTFKTYFKRGKKRWRDRNINDAENH